MIYFERYLTKPREASGFHTARDHRVSTRLADHDTMRRARRSGYRAIGTGVDLGADHVTGHHCYEPVSEVRQIGAEISILRAFHGVPERFIVEVELG